MLSPIYQTPAFPYACNSGISPAPDNGTCQSDTDTTAYYPAPMPVEANCSQPSGSPAFVSGISIYPMVQPNLAGVIGYSYNTPGQAWELYANIFNTCSSGSCIFSRSYSPWCNL